MELRYIPSPIHDRLIPSLFRSLVFSWPGGIFDWLFWCAAGKFCMGSLVPLHVGSIPMTLILIPAETRQFLLNRFSAADLCVGKNRLFFGFHRLSVLMRVGNSRFRACRLNGLVFPSEVVAFIFTSLRAHSFLCILAHSMNINLLSSPFILGRLPTIVDFLILDHLVMSALPYFAAPFPPKKVAPPLTSQMIPRATTLHLQHSNFSFGVRWAASRIGSSPKCCSQHFQRNNLELYPRSIVVSPLSVGPFYPMPRSVEKRLYRMSMTQDLVTVQEDLRIRC